MRKTLIAANALFAVIVAGAIAIPGAALAGPTTYDLSIFLGAPDPFAAAFYGATPGTILAAPPVAPAPFARAPIAPGPVTPRPVAPVAAIAAAAPAVVPIKSPVVTVPETQSTVRRVAGLALDRAYLVGNVGFVSASDATNSGTGVNNKWIFDSGLMVQAAYGYRWQERATTEVEVAWRSVGAKTVTESGGAAIKATGDVSVMSVLANVTYEFPNGYQVTPYALGGLGFARYTAASVTAPGSSTVKSNDWVIGYQFGAGLIYPLGDRWA
ncbi:MAG: outer membrane beta-barrel protein, partial [Alphaproteobacteria bacterium]|nr:outer membrane beta-barrel protein [Alphaproteobacteria bacterium]